ncbi:NBR1-Ig-like domain-containing protein [Actinomadura sp. ATCC 31491]|uniref:NBR1-Ig-like domain-containing protein n=1 Tax=Actinomadura luzonensis TaxID=2805427 RepID=A0ABT0FNA6_9ACTN|nr:NBR1-Ig-like domain-containing protein [Actinomadura luzonensis]MCK2213734.1 NBR1-Ig-like domain-containing protein [Actinomadura luzonensis]
MSGRSGAISHTTLHEATKGNRLPSWETTVEFVKACDADPAAYRERWESANRVVRSAGTGDRAGRELAEARAVPLTTGSPAARPAGGITVSVPPPPLGDARPAPPAPGTNGRPRPPTRPAVLVTAAAVVGVAALAVAATTWGFRTEPAGPAPSAAGLSPADCPVRATNPPWAAPPHEGDAAQFIADITLSDCTRVPAGETVSKVWRLKNAGTVPWKGYSLRRLDPGRQADQCQTISDVPIKDTPPGETVDIQTAVTTPRKPGLCYVRFKVVDASGAVAFPGNRPINFQIIVE